MKEMGTTEPFNASNPQSGVVNAYQRVVSGTGEFEGATGYLFVSGFNRNQRVVTALPGIEQPALVMHLAGDRVIPAAFGRMLGKRLKRARPQIT